MLIVAELVGRAVGLHEPIVFERTHYGYRAVPGQSLNRFGNRIDYDARGLRSEPTPARPGPGVLRVLCLGDSVTNGGAVTDQQATMPYRLQAFLHSNGQRAEVLNASAPGWAIANELGWLKAHGTQGGHFVVLTLSTHDLFQAMASSDVVGRHPSFPERRPHFAIEESVRRYLLPWLSVSFSSEDPGVADTSASERAASDNRRLIAAIEEVVRAQGGQLVIVYLDETAAPWDGEAKPLAEREKAALFSMLEADNVAVLTLDYSHPGRERFRLFRDGVHPNNVGNQAIAEVVGHHLLGRRRSHHGTLQ